MKFSVIIPTYNRSNQLRTLLNTLVNQNFKDFEVVICDDGSTDDTFEMISHFKDVLDINYNVFPNSGGPAYPRNVGIEASRYDWLCFLDSDDSWTDDKLEVLASNILKFENEIYCHPVYLMDESNQKLGVIGRYKKGLFLDDFDTLLYNGSKVVNSSICVKKSILTPNYYYNTDKKYHAIEDYIFLLNLTQAGYRIKNIPQILGYYNLHQNNISADLSKQLLKWDSFFSSKPFKNVSYSKINSLLYYISASSNNESKSDKIKIYSNLVFRRESTFEIKLKSFYKLFFILLGFKI